MLKKLKENILVRNTLIIIITSLLIKMLSLLNRVFLTRLLGNTGISLYVLVLPTIMLLLSLGGFSLNITISKIVAENEKKREYTYQTILKSSIKIGLISSFLTIFIYIFFIRFIAYTLLKQPTSFYPLLSSIIIIPFVSLNNCYRGFYNGLNDVKYSSFANLIEQISRLLFSVLLLYIFRDFDIITCVTISIIAMAIGEIISLGYIVGKVNKFIHLKDEYNQYSRSHQLNKIIFSLSLSQTLSHLIANISFFFEPIIYTYALNKISINNNEILYLYSEISAYTMPLLTMFFFTTSAIATVIIPTISKNQGTNIAKNISASALKLSFLPGIYLGVILFYYSTDYMNLLYNTSIGANYTHMFSLIFIFFYTQPVLIGILQATGNQSKLLFISIFDSIMKSILIYYLTFISNIGYQSLIYAIIITNVLATIILFMFVKKTINFKINVTNIIKLIILFIMIFYTIYLLKYFKINYLFSTLISLVIYFIYVLILKINLKFTYTQS